MMNVKLNTQDYGEIDTRPFVDSWFNKKARRVNAAPSGPRRSDKPTEEEEEVEFLSEPTTFYG